MAPKRPRTAPPHPRAVPPESLRWTCDPDWFEFDTTAELGDCPIHVIGLSA